MRPLTFFGYLRTYVPRLADMDSQALSKLAERLSQRPRATEPLLLLAVVSGRTEETQTLLSTKPRLLAELELLTRLEMAGDLEGALEREDPRLRPEYHKVWRGYVVRRDAGRRDADLKLEARRRVLQLEKSKSVTRYRMAKDLGLNQGNLYAFLAQGNVSKLSLERAYQLVEYLEAA